MRSDNVGFSSREVRALLWLLPVLAVVSWIVWGVNHSPPPDEPQPEADGVVLSTPQKPQPDSVVLFTFDPNTIDYHDLLRLGFERGEALGIIKYRERGKVFEIAEDFAACYQVSETMYRRLRPYIRIGERFRLKSWAETSQSGVRTSSSEGQPKPDAAVPSPPQPPQPDGSVPSPPSGRRSTLACEGEVVGLPDSGSRRGSPPHHQPPLVDLNTADSATLVTVSGIGPVTAPRIVEYRTRLGGFAAVEQLAEVRGVTEQNYERMVQQIWVDPAVIQKIDINFAPAKSLATHPYIGAAALRKLLKERQLKGGWRNTQELAMDDIFTADELNRLGPYLVFN